MRFLLDTHTLLWWLSDDPALPELARKVIARSSSHILVSAASAWEIATKVRLGKLPTATDLVRDFAGYLARERFESLAVGVEHGTRAGLLSGPHKDPFDRMLVAQAQTEDLSVISNDAVFDSYGVERVW